MSKKDKDQKVQDPVEGQNETLEGVADAPSQQQVEAEENPDTLSETDALKEELGKERDKFLRLFAEFENYKKRTSKERMELFKTAGQEVLSSMLPVLDDFERALKEIAKSSDEELYKGVALIENKLRETLRSKGLEEIEVAVGEPFDADVHEAITQIPAPEEKLKGKVLDVIEKGYKLGERVVRHPKVVVGQ